MARRGAVLRGAQAIPGGARPTAAPQGSVPYNNGRGLNAPSIGQFSPLAAQLANEGGYARTYGPFLPRPTESFTAGAFGPFSPILPVPVDSPPPEFERPEPRRWEYAVGWNLPTGAPGNEGLRLANFETMRRLADVYSVARACIEYRKNQVRGIEWDITPTPAAAKAYQGNPAKMADFGKRQAKAVKFFNRPDPNYFSYSLWLSAVLEDIFVYDALSILIRPVWGKGRNKGVLGSDLDSLMLLTGSTIRPLVDLHGGTPRPPAPGYQQYLYGVPRSDYMTMMMHRDIEEAGMSGQDVAQFRGDQLLYLPMVPRAWTPYGFSPIERAIIPIMTGLQKQAYQYDFFEEGTVPAAYIIPGDTAMTPNQLRELQDALNAIAGDPAWKQKLIVLPPGSHVEPQRPVITADELDQLVMSQVTMAFGVTPLELGLSPGRSSTTSPGAANQMSKMTQNNSQDANITPILKFLQDIFNGILEHVCGQTDMMFTFEGLQQEEDMDALTGVLVQQFQNGMRTLDECRQELNLQPYGLEESSEPLIVTPTGPTPLSTAVANAQNAAAQSAAQAQQTQAGVAQAQAQTAQTHAQITSSAAASQMAQESHAVSLNEPSASQSAAQATERAAQIAAAVRQPQPTTAAGAEGETPQQPQPTSAAGAEGSTEAAQSTAQPVASPGSKPTPGHHAAIAANNEAASTKKSLTSVTINKVGPKGYSHGWVHDNLAVDTKPMFYHGTTRHFRPGDLISPASQVPGSERTGSYDESSPDHVYLTRDPGRAAEYAGMRDDPEPESPRDDRYSVYQVEPTGEFERDPQHATTAAGYDVEPNYRSTSPVKVIRRLPYTHQQIASAAIDPWGDDDPRLSQEVSHPLYAGNLARKREQRRADAELEALTRHLAKGRHVTTWEARHVSQSLLAHVAKAMAEGLDPRSAVSLARAHAGDVVLPRTEYAWEDEADADADADAGPGSELAAVKAGGAPFHGVETAELTWPGWERDQNLAAVYAPRIADAFTDGLASARSFLTQLISGEVRVTPTYAAQEVRNRLAAAIKPVLTSLWTEGYALGAISARHVVRNTAAASASTASAAAAAAVITKDLTSNPYPEYITGPDWGEWEPGDVESALKVGTGPRLQQLLHQWGVNTIQSVSETKLDDLAKHIAIALATGQNASSLASDISSLLNVPSRAKMIAQTEISRASSAAALDQYLAAGVGSKQWLVSPEDVAGKKRVCDRCQACADEGPIPLQQAFVTGVDAPGNHPWCRCSVIPASVGDFDLSDMTVEPLPGFNLVPLGQPVTASANRPDLTKVGKEGYIHGFICVRPPCGEKPGKLKASELSIRRDGTILHKPSGYQVGTVSHDDGRFTVTHSDGHTSHHKNNIAAVNTIVGHYNSGKTQRVKDDEIAGTVSSSKPVESLHVPNYDELDSPIKATGTYTGYPMVGASVSHPSLGFGNVTAMTPDNSRVTVQFKHGMGEHEFPVESTSKTTDYDFKDTGPAEDTAPVSLNKPFKSYFDLPAVQRKAVEAYIKPTTIVNHRLRHYDFAVDDSTVKTLDKMVNERTLTDDAVLYRGVALTPEMRQSMVPGASFTDKAYTSLSDRVSFAKDFAELRATGKDRWGNVNTADITPGSVPAMMLVHVPAGTHTAQGQDGLGEYILPRNTTLTIRNVSADGRVFHVEASENSLPTQKMMQYDGKVSVASHRLVHERGDGDWLLPNEIQPDLTKVGPKGYVHGWIKVGPEAHAAVIQRSDLSEDEQSALTKYHTSWYTDINQSLRNGGTDPLVDSLDAAMTRGTLSSPILVHRSVDDPSLIFGDNWENQDLTGKKWTDRAFTSTSAAGKLSPNGAFGAAWGAHLIMTVPPGVSAISVSPNSEYENEILLDRGLNFEVTRELGKQGPSGQRTLKVSVSPRKSVEKSHHGEKSVTCGHGHKHWGQYGAAGMMIRGRRPNGDVVYLLQQRASTSADNAGKWGTFGGALLPGETPLQGATREVNEELGKVNVVDGNLSAGIIQKVGEEGYIHGWIYEGPEGNAAFQSAAEAWKVGRESPAQVSILRHAVSVAPAASPPLYRGLYVSADDARAQQLLHASPGDKIAEGMASWSSDVGTARDFSGATSDIQADVKNPVSIMMELASGAHSVPVSGIGKWGMEQEHLAGGQYEVTGSRDETWFGENIHVVSVRQVKNISPDDDSTALTSAAESEVKLP